MLEEQVKVITFCLGTVTVMLTFWVFHVEGEILKLKRRLNQLSRKEQ